MPCSHHVAAPPPSAVFDTAILVEGHLYQLDQHLQRFLTNAARANIPLPPGMSAEQMRRTVLETAASSCKLNGAGRRTAARVPAECCWSACALRLLCVPRAVRNGAASSSEHKPPTGQHALRVAGWAAGHCHSCAQLCCRFAMPHHQRAPTPAHRTALRRDPPLAQALCATGCLRGVAALG